MIPFYRWAMRNGSAILFTMSLLVFIVSLTAQFIAKWSTMGGSTLSMETGAGPDRLWFFIATLVQAISSSALIFAAACVVHWLERRFDGKGTAE